MNCLETELESNESAYILGTVQNASILSRNGGIKVLDKNNQYADFIKVIEVNTGGGGDEVVTVIPFTNADLVSGQLIKLHGLNRRVVSVTVTNTEGLEFEPSVNNLNDNTRVQIDLSDCNITGIWYLTIR